MSMVIISGNIDISVGALIGVLATISGSLAVAGAPIIVTWLAPLVVGVAVMAAQGAIIAYLRIPAIVVTLGMLSILKGGLISVTGGKWITDLPQNFHLADLIVLGVPMPVVIMVLATVAGGALDALFSATRPRDLRDRRQCRGGAPLRRQSRSAPCVMVFALHGFFAGLASLVYATQLRVIQSTTPPGLELTIITAAVVGGVSILGGVGTVVGSTLAAILIAEITSALVFINVSPYWTDAVARRRSFSRPSSPTSCAASAAPREDGRDEPGDRNEDVSRAALAQASRDAARDHPRDRARRPRPR